MAWRVAHFVKKGAEFGYAVDYDSPKGSLRLLTHTGWRRQMQLIGKEGNAVSWSLNC